MIIRKTGGALTGYGIESANLDAAALRAEVNNLQQAKADFACSE